MTTKKISAFPVATSVLPTDVGIGNVGGTTQQIPLSVQLDFMEANISNLGNVSGNFSGIHSGDGSALINLVSPGPGGTTSTGTLSMVANSSGGSPAAVHSFINNGIEFGKFDENGRFGVGVSTIVGGKMVVDIKGAGVDLANQVNGTIAFGDIGTDAPAIVGRVVGDVAGIHMQALTADGNTGGDYVIDVRRNTGAAHITLTTTAYSYRYNGTKQFSILRDGRVAIGDFIPSAMLAIGAPISDNSQNFIHVNRVDFPDQRHLTVVTDSSGDVTLAMRASNAEKVKLSVVGDSFLAGGGLLVGISSLTNLGTDNLAVGGGVLTLKETTTPLADVNYGKIYTKTDNALYFQDGAGVEHTVTIS